MLNEFVQVSEKESGDRLFINLSDISFIRENKTDDTSVLSIKNKEKLFFHVLESFDSFEEFFDQDFEE